MRPTPVASGPDDLSVLEIGRTAIGTVHVDAAQVSHILLITNLFFFIQYSHQYLWGPIFCKCVALICIYFPRILSFCYL